MIVSFDKIPDENHNCAENRENIRHIAMELAVYLEVEARTAEQYKSKGLFSRK